MATFLSDLWTSVFTPGTTPTLLIATNATFAALQLTLFALLVGTHSIHFIILSFLCGGLWWSINWFAMEVAAAKLAEERETEQARTADQDQELRQLDGTATDSFPASASTVTGQPSKPGGTGTETQGGMGGAGSRRRRLADSEVSTDNEWVKLESESS